MPANPPALPNSRKPRIPSYRLHRATGCAVVTLDGRDVYLGRHGTPESRSAYERLIAEWMLKGGAFRNIPATPAADRAASSAPAAAVRSADPPRATQSMDPAYSVSELLADYLDFADRFYVGPDGKPTGEVRLRIAPIARVLNALYGPTPAAEFGPKALKAVRQQYVDGTHVRYLAPHRNRRAGASEASGETEPGSTPQAVGSDDRAALPPAPCTRKTCNQMAMIVRRIFKWGVSEELIPATVLYGLMSVDPLRRGRSEARESEAVTPVADAHVDAIRPYVSAEVWAMIELQRLTGMRSTEVCTMQASRINMEGELWEYSPATHKSARFGYDRKVMLGPRAQALIREFLTSDREAFLFSPARAERARRAKLSAARRIPLKWGNRPGTNRRRNPIRKLRDRYDCASYGRAIARGIEKANAAAAASSLLSGPKPPQTPHWHPHQLRHNYASAIRRKFGVELARIMCGHRSVGTTEIYAERDLAAAARVARETG